MDWNGQYDGLRESNAFFRPMRIPEQCSGEMLSAELQREFCFKQLDDAFIQNTGSHLLKELRKSNNEDAKWFSHFLETVARYPTPSRQAAKHDIAYTIPFIPSIALFSTPRRITKRNEGDSNEQDRSWKPGAFLKECLSYCVPSNEIDDFFMAIQRSLLVSEEDDLFARFISQKTNEALQEYLSISLEQYFDADAYKMPENKKCFMPQNIRDRIKTAPFKRFADDIKAVLSVKAQLSRCQFMAMLESLIRLGTSSHVIWMCNINQRIERKIFDLFRQDRSTYTEEDLFEALNMPSKGIFSYGMKFLAKMKDFFKNYEYSTKRLSFLLFKLKEETTLPSFIYDWSSTQSFVTSINEINTYMKMNPAFLDSYDSDFSRHYNESIKKYTLKVDCQATHLLRFVQTTLLQNNQPDNERYSRYDQSYLLRHRTHSNRSSIILNAGAVTLMTLVHCCSYRSGTILLSNLIDALLMYGISIPQGETEIMFKNQLRELGLTIDSPDAESGMVLQNIIGENEEKN